jgi:predicted tellurium resistance membrane protein TerC
MDDAPVFFLVVLLMGLGWLLSQKGNSLFTVMGKGFDLASIVMLAGGLFLIYKSVHEIHQKLEGEDPNQSNKNAKGISFSQAIGQIIIN